MLKRKRGYICDLCGAVALEQTYYFINDSWKGPPEEWGKLGKSDLCPICVETYERIRSEVIKEKENAEN